MSLPEVVHWLEAPPTHVPRMEKHPAERFMPLAKVEVAVVVETLSTDTSRGPENVDVAPAVLVSVPVRVPPESGR